MYTLERLGTIEMVSHRTKSPTHKHGSEEFGTVTPQCRALHEGESTTLDEHDKLSFPSDLDLMREILLGGEQILQCGEHPFTDTTPKEARPNPRDWKMADVISWLEEQKIPRQGIQVCRENAINGTRLIHILASENRQQILAEEFGVTSPLQREVIICDMKALCENMYFTSGIEAEKCEGSANFSNERMLLMGKESFRIQSIRCVCVLDNCRTSTSGRHSRTL